MVGRARERERLRADFADVVARTCRLFTLIGPAGVGKSRLVADFLEHVEGRRTVARGRALSYGEGITYWPLVELLVQLGIDPTEAIRSSPADTQLATRALLEQLGRGAAARARLDDLQWAEPPLLDLVEHVADWSREAPIFLLCIARPELLDVRPGWGGGKVNATSVLLEPLAADESRSAGRRAPRGRRARRRDAGAYPRHRRGQSVVPGGAGGARAGGGGHGRRSADDPRGAAGAPRRARRPRASGDRAGLGRGQVFHRGAVTALAPPSPRGRLGASAVARSQGARAARIGRRSPETTRFGSGIC